MRRTEPDVDELEKKVGGGWPWKVLDGIPPDDLRAVLGVARRWMFDRGEVVFHQDDPGDTLHLIVQGRFAVARRTTRGEEALLVIRGPGEAFGEFALIAEQNRSATVSSLDSGETIAIHRHEFNRLRVEHPSVDRMLAGVLAEQLDRMNHLLTEAFYESAQRRVLRRLLELDDSNLDGQGEDIRVTQWQLGAFAGASRSTVAAVLAEEQRRGTIAIRRGATAVRDRATLARRAGMPLVSR